MSIFSTPIPALATADLQELLDDQAVENVRLEFKREVPGKDETLKKLSSFANTFGGYLVVGAEAGNDGRINGLPGVELRRGYKQTIIQWCTGGASPPLTAEVSDPIPTLTGDGRMCYVISVPESEFSPHFLNGRKGSYVRTDEFSARFEPRLATERKLRYLLGRRRLTRERRTSLLQRARERFQTFSRQQTTKDPKGSKPPPVFLALSLVPRYPARPVVEHAKLLSLLRETTVAWRGVVFPRNQSIISQHESAIALRPSNRWSLLEANIWGMLRYAIGIEAGLEEYGGIHRAEFVGYVLVVLEHAARIMRELGLTTAIHVELLLQGVRGVPWVYFPEGVAEHGPRSELDDTVSFTLTTTTDVLTMSRDGLAMDVLRLVFFAMNWPGTADDPQKLAALVTSGYQYNRWPPPTTTTK